MDINFRPILFFTFLIFFSLNFYAQTKGIKLADLQPLIQLFEPEEVEVEPTISPKEDIVSQENYRVEEVFACIISLTGSNNQSVCQGEAISNISYSVDTGAILTVSSLPGGLTVSGEGTSSITISGIPTSSSTFTVSASGGSCGSEIKSGSITVTPTVGTPTAITGTPPTCQLTNGTTTTAFATTATNSTGFNWTLSNPAAGSIDPATGVMTWANGFSGSVNIQVTANGCNGPSAQTVRTITVQPYATTGLPVAASGQTAFPFPNYPSVCKDSNPVLRPFIQSTTGVTGIGIPTGLPAGVTAVFNPTTGNIEFSGNVSGATTGLYTYNIPLTGNCINGLTATGTIDVTPNYQLSSVSSVSATSAGGTATVTVNADPLLVTNGTYQVQYQIAQGVAPFGPVTTSSNFTINNGRGSYGVSPINSLTATYTVQIVSIRKITDTCCIDLSASPPTTYFGACSAVFTTNTTFYVPPNIYSVTIQVYGGGGGGENGANKKGGGGGGYSIRTLSVTPGEAIGVFVGDGGGKNINGGISYVTRDSNIADQKGNSLLYAEGGISGEGSADGGKTDSRYPGGSDGAKGTGINGGNGGGPLGSTIGKGGNSNNSGNKGQIRISYSCPDANKTDCLEYVDDGATTGTTIIRYICDGVWNAPEGLTDFSVLVGGAGGGGGSGNGGGGGGAGSLVIQSYNITNPYGMPPGSNYTITTGSGGSGSTGVNVKGSNGSSSSFTGSVNGSAINMTASGGGGGGSASTGNYIGNVGASGGGGAANSSNKGVGGSSSSAGSTGGTIYSGKAGGKGENNKSTAIAGGGGGGINTDPALAIGQDGKAAGKGQGEGGNGGQGASLNFGGTIINYGAGGGGIGALFNGTDKIGVGGIAGGQKIGGDGNLLITANGGVGYPGVPYSGSGGGAGYNGGGKGGNGIVYISFFNFRILDVEYQYFTATYSPENRSSLLKWATAKEWENSHFEIERSVDGVSAWTKIGQEVGQGYSESPKDYSYTDTNLPASGGVVYYRLKQVDFDGSFSYSVTKSIKVEGIKGQGSWVAYPNPSSKKNAIKVNLLNHAVYNDEPILIQISDIRGVSETFTVNQVESVSEVVNRYMEQSKPGVYILQLIWGNNSQQLKLLRE